MLSEGLPFSAVLVSRPLSGSEKDTNMSQKGGPAGGPERISFRNLKSGQFSAPPLTANDLVKVTDLLV